MPSKKNTFLKAIAAMGLVASCAAAQASADDPNGPEGFGQNTTGGGVSGRYVEVHTRDELEREICGKDYKKGICTDEAKIVAVVGTIDFRGEEGPTSSTGCYYDTKNNPLKAILTLADPAHACTESGIKKQQIGYDKVGTDPLLVGSNKTIIGKGATATIKGRGFALRHVKNVIIRNLTITDINPSVIWAGDAIDLQDVDNVWIDHNRISLVGRQMIVAHFGPITHVTISWNEFDGRTPYLKEGHYWNVLFNSYQKQLVTISNNWFHDFSGRAPALHNNGAFQLVNNYFQYGRGHALEVFEGANVLVEGNAFEQVDQPITKDPGDVFALVGKDDNAQKSCIAFLGRRCGNNNVIGYSDLSGFRQSIKVLNAFKGLPLLKPYKTSNVPSVVKSQAGPGHIAP